MKPGTNQAINPVVTAFSPPGRVLRRRWLNGLGVGGQGLGEEPKCAAMMAGYQKMQPLMNGGGRGPAEPPAAPQAQFANLKKGRFMLNF